MKLANLQQHLKILVVKAIQVTQSGQGVTSSAVWHASAAIRRDTLVGFVKRKRIDQVLLVVIQKIASEMVGLVPLTASTNLAMSSTDRG